MLRLNQLSTGFKTKCLQKGISLNFEPGTIALLLGRNGVGKSVFLRTLMGIQKPLQGEVTINDQNLHSLKPERRANLISLMLSTPPQVELLTALEVACSSIKHNKEAENNAKIWFQNLEILNLTHKAFGQCSDGEKQKIMLTRCLMQNTPVILMDEPTAFLDYPAKIQFWNTMKSISANKIIVVSTHDIDTAIPNATHLIHLKNQDATLSIDPLSFNLNLL
jgi:iron complex transport system ATP-binding protein